VNCSIWKKYLNTVVEVFVTTMLSYSLNIQGQNKLRCISPKSHRFALKSFTAAHLDPGVRGRLKLQVCRGASSSLVAAAAVSAAADDDAVHSLSDRKISLYSKIVRKKTTVLSV